MKVILGKKMISIIICSRTPELSFDEKKSIEETIGTLSDGSAIEYELIVIDNSNKKHSICQAYNKGVSFAKGEYLCFVHDDVIFVSRNWGAAIISALKDKSIGMIGIAGTHFLPKAPGGWWRSNIRSQNIIQGRIIRGKYVSQEVVEDSYRNKTDKLVAADGVFLCFRKEIFEKIRWDEAILTGFHGYDLDISLQVLKNGYEIKILWDILLEHKSYGCGDGCEQFRQSCRTIFEKWRDFLPQIRGIEMTSDEIFDKTRIIELENEIFEIKRSKEYLLGNVLYHTDHMTMAVVRRIKKIFGI